jgi:hypothetical protein
VATQGGGYAGFLCCGTGAARSDIGCAGAGGQSLGLGREKKLGGIEYRTSAVKTHNAETEQYQVDVGKKNDMFLYGETTKIDPSYAQPGQAGLPGSATGEPETRYGLGVGFRF